MAGQQHRSSAVLTAAFTASYDLPQEPTTPAAERLQCEKLVEYYLDRMRFKVDNQAFHETCDPFGLAVIAQQVRFHGITRRSRP